MSITRAQVEKVTPFVKRLHLDFADGHLAPVKLISLDEAWLPDNVICDLHLMYQKPEEVLDKAIKLKPKLVILHAEAEGNFIELADKLKKAGIKVGVAILAKTPVEKIKPSIEVIDHVLIFSGDLGHFGGKADMALIKKIGELRQLKPSLEIGWDGGVNEQNAKTLSRGGVDVLNVGGFIQHAELPQEAYATLESSIK